MKKRLSSFVLAALIMFGSSTMSAFSVWSFVAAAKKTAQKSARVAKKYIAKGATQFALGVFAGVMALGSYWWFKNHNNTGASESNTDDSNPPEPAPVPNDFPEESSGPGGPRAVRLHNITIGQFACPGRMRNISDTVCVKEIKVKQQHSAGGAASCGYQALKNGMYIALGLQGRINNLHREINSVARITQLFGVNNGRRGPWRTYVLNERCKIVFREYVKQEVIKLRNRDGINENKGLCIGSEDNEDVLLVFSEDSIRGRYQVICDRIADHIVNRVATENRVEITIAEIIQFFAREVDNIIPENITRYMRAPKWYETFFNSVAYEDCERNEIRAKLLLHLKNEQTIRQYIDLSGFGVKHEFKVSQIMPYFNAYNRRHPNNRLCREGDWIDGDNIQNLVRFEFGRDRSQLRAGVRRNLSHLDYDSFNTELFRDSNFRITVIEDLANAFQLNGNDINLAKGLANGQSHVFIVRLGLSQQQAMRNSSVSGGHWFTVVLHKNNDGKSEYIVADSADATFNRLNDIRVNQFIRLIEPQARFPRRHRQTPTQPASIPRRKPKPTHRRAAST